MARPKKSPDELRDAYVRLRFSDAEKRSLTEFAQGKGQALAVWARSQLLAAMKGEETGRESSPAEEPEDVFRMVVPMGKERVEVSLRSV